MCTDPDELALSVRRTTGAQSSTRMRSRSEHSDGARDASWERWWGDQGWVDVHTGMGEDRRREPSLAQEPSPELSQSVHARETNILKFCANLSHPRLDLTPTICSISKIVS